MKKLLAALLAALTLCTALSGCRNNDPDNYVPTGDALLMEGQDPEELMPEDTEHQSLILAYYPERSMNPIIGNNITNRSLFSLIYQGLFAVDSRNRTYPILCNRYRVSPDRNVYTFYVDTNARFSDGSRVTIDDVFATYEAAKQSDYYKGRFNHVAEFRKNDDGSITFYLDTPFENFAILLDIPIVKASQVDADYPVGTGPYKFQLLSGTAQLARVENWWNDVKISTNAEVINLLEATTQAAIRDEFEFGDLDLALANPMTDSYAEYRCDYELWQSESGVFLYLGVNMYGDYFKNDTVLRKALTYAIDRETINNEYYHGLGQVTTLPTSPGCPYYSPSLAPKYEYDPMKFLDLISGFTIPKDDKGAVKKLRILVNSDDSARLRVARYLAARLTELGIPAGTLEYPTVSTGTTYEAVLKAANYELYLGQTKLSPTYDLNEFFRGWGNLSYGGIADNDLLKLNKEALANSGNYYNLNQAVAEDGKIIPILFGCNAVYAERGQLLDLTPARDNVFFYTIGKTMADILEENNS